MEFTTPAYRSRLSTPQRPAASAGVAPRQYPEPQPVIQIEQEAPSGTMLGSRPQAFDAVVPLRRPPSLASTIEATTVSVTPTVAATQPSMPVVAMSLTPSLTPAFPQGTNGGGSGGGIFPSSPDKEPKPRHGLLSLLGRYGPRGLSILLVLTGVVALAITYQMNHRVDQQIKKYDSQANDSGQHGSSGGSKGSNGTSSGSTTNNTTDPRLPKRIQIPSLGINAAVGEVGLNSKGQIGTPPNIAETAWYDNSSSPRDPVGNALITGHLGSDSYHGAFYSLGSIKTGATITITMGDNATHTYKVTSLKSVPEAQVNMAAILSYKGATGRLLHLMTCGGQQDTANYTYPDRVIVSAVEE